MKLFHWIVLILIGFMNPLTATGQQGPHKVGLVLSGGGARGAAHIGVLRVFERERIPIDCIAGTSFGALAGGLYSLGYSTAKIEEILTGQDWNSIFSDAPERRLTPLIERRNSRYQGQISFRGWSPELPTGFRGGQRLTEALDILTTNRMVSAGYDFAKKEFFVFSPSARRLGGVVFIRVWADGESECGLRKGSTLPRNFRISRASVQSLGMGISDILQGGEG